MSSSISIASSAGLSSFTSKSANISKNQFNYEDYYNGLETELKSIRTARLNRAESRSYKEYHNNLFSRNSSAKINQDNNKRDRFYDEVDDRMSRNSVEYPQQQAKYAHVNRWLNDYQTFNCNTNEVCYRDLGNVIGIKGYGKLISSTCQKCEGHQEEVKKQRANYNKLKFSFVKLDSDYERLKTKFSEFIEKSKRILRHKDNNLYVLKKALREKRKRINDFKCNCQQLDRSNLIKDLKSEILSECKELKGDINTLDTNNAALIEELEKLRIQVKNLSLEPNNRQILGLRKDNERLKSIIEVNSIEFNCLKENYCNLEKQIQNLLLDQRNLEEEKNQEVSKLLVDLCRFQVQQPKLESLLEIERQIKLEHENKIIRLEEDKQRLSQRIENLLSEKNKQTTYRDTDQLRELEKIRSELSVWQAKCDRLERDKSDCDELIRSMKTKLNSIDNQRVFERDRILEGHKREIEKLEDSIRQKLNRESILQNKVNELSEKLKESENLKESLILESQSLYRKIESNLEFNNKQQMEALEKQIQLLKEATISLDSENSQLKYDLKESKSFSEKLKQQITDLQHRYKTQQQAFEELRQKRDSEVSKIRTDLNFERYNRQVALKGMERQLRVSLRELDNVKTRFMQSGGNRIPPPSLSSSLTRFSCAPTNSCTSNSNSKIVNKNYDNQADSSKMS